MSFQNLVRQTSTTTGTGNLTVASTETGWRTMADAFGTGSGNKFRYVIRHQSTQPVEWESGIGYMSNSTTLVRDAVIASSNANAAVSFSSGTKEISADVPAENFSLIGNSDKVGNGSPIVLGYPTIGGSDTTFAVGQTFIKKISLPSNGFIDSIKAYLNGDSGGHVQLVEFLVHADAAGTPGKVIHSTGLLQVLLEAASSTPTARWLSSGMNFYNDAGAVDVWIGVMNGTAGSPGAGKISFDGSGSDRHYTTAGAWPADYGRYSPTTTTNKYSIACTFRPTA